jgi:hypothetical protein
MPYIVIDTKYPADKADEVAKAYLEVLKKYPPDDSLGTEVVPVATKATLQGVRGFAVSEVKEGKLEAAFIRSANVMAMFRNIPGYEYTIDVYLTAGEALATIGM